MGTQKLMRQREMEMASANACAARAMREATRHQFTTDAALYWEIWQETELMARDARARWLAAVAEQGETTPQLKEKLKIAGLNLNQD